MTNAFKSDDSSLSISLPGTRLKGMTFPKKVRTPYRKLFLPSLIWTVIFILLLIPATSSVAGVVSSPVHTEVQVNLLNLRTGPSTSYTRIQGLPSGTPLEVLFQEKEWLLVRLKDGTTGWVDGKYTGFTSSLADKLPPVIGEKATVTVNLLNVRLGAGLNYQRINQLHLHDTVTVYFHEGDWVLVRLADETSGWIYHEYTSFAPQAAGTEPQIPDINAASETPPSATHQQLTSAEEEEQFPYNVIVTSTHLPLREQPQLNSTPLEELTKDMVLTVLDKTNEDWLQVELPDGRQGWVAGWCTQKLEEDKNSENKGTDPFIRLAAVTADVLRVRSGPGLDYTQTGRVFCGNHLLIQQEQNGWYYVRTPTGQYGWVSSEYTTPINIVSRGNSSAKAYDVTQSQNITVVIDPGHGGEDKGATGVSGLKEKNVNLTVSLYLEELLRARGFNVVMTRKNDTYLTLAERAALAEKAKADLFISIHANASLNNKYASGTETYYYQNKKTSPQSLYLASLIQQEVSAVLKLPNLGVKKAPFHVLRETSMPAALVELAFLSNAVDETILASDHCLKLAAEALYRAVLRYYNLNQ